MAEKEERIFIGFINPEGDACPVPYGKCNSLCDNCKGGMTRSEAIEKTAKANWIATVCDKNQCVPVDITKEQWDEEWEKLRIDYKKVYYAGAEAALDALLGESND